MTQTEIKPGLKRNTFEGGMVQDILHQYAQSNTYQYALNAVHNSHNFSLNSRGLGSTFLVNEKSNTLCASFNAKVVGISYIDERNQSLVFTRDNKISLFDHKSKEVIELIDGSNFSNDDKCALDLRGSCWDFSKCEMMYAVFKTLQPCNETIAYFSSGCHFYRINIDELLDPQRRNCLTCKDFRLMKCTNSPHLTAQVQERGGYGLEAGAYYFLAQLADKDGNTSNWFFVKGPAHVGSENNIAGELSRSVIDVRVDCLDTRYNHLNLAVMRKIDGSLREPELIYTGNFTSKGTSIQYYSKDQAIRTLSFEEIYHKKQTYLRGKDLFIKDGRLWLYKIKQHRNLNYQSRANSITGKVAVFEVPIEYAHLYPSLQRSEAYMPAIVWVYCDGTTSAAFPIPASGGSSDGSRPPNKDNDGGGPLGSASYLKASVPATGDSNDTESGGASMRASDTNYIPNQVIRRRVNELQDTYKSEACNSATFTVPDSLKIDETEERAKAIIDSFSTTLDDYCQAVEIREESIKAQNCLCGPTGCIDCDGEATVVTTNSSSDTNTDGSPNSTSTSTITANCCPTACCNGEKLDGTPAKTACDTDLPLLETAYTNWSDWMADIAIDKKEPTFPSTNLISAASRLFQQAVLEREVKVYVSGGSCEGGGGFSSNAGIKDLKKGSSKNMDADGKETKEGQPRFVGYGRHKVKRTSNLYPNIKDCEGNRMYPEGQISLFEMPSEAEMPLVKNTQTGVVSEFTPEGANTGDTFAYILGFEFSNIVTPDPAELPKPLSCTNPYKIVYVKRDEINSSVIANGVFFGTFDGSIRGIPHAFPRHSVNSMEPVDRHIDNNGSRIGENANTPRYIFHSPDTNLRKIPLISTHVIHNGTVGGKGWRHGLYAKGREPELNQDQGTRLDNKGARHSIDLGIFTPGGGTRIDISGIKYAGANKIESAAAGIDIPLSNNYRESSVYLQTATTLPALSGDYAFGSYSDRSFLGDVLDHVAPVEGAAWKGSLARDLDDQYGTVENQTYIDLGLEANKNSGSVIRGYCGDVYIQQHTLKRSSWVSEKVGNDYNIPALVTHKEKRRTICDSPEDELFTYTGNNIYATRLPETGDAADAKNWAGLHTDAEAFTRPIQTRTVNLDVSVEGAWTSIAEGYTPLSDVYYPQFTKSLVTFYAEGKANGHFRQTGEGSQLKTGHVYYPKLKDLGLDANAPGSQFWETTWLPRIAAVIEQPSRHKIKMKAAIRNVLAVGIPLLAGAGAMFLSPFESIPALGLTGGSMYAIFKALLDNLFNEQWLSELLGFPRCRTDNEGTEDGARITPFEDNYFQYSSDFSEVNDLQFYYGMPENYFTCDCDNCLDDETTNEIYYSNKQIINSQVDAYRNFEAFAYNNLDADTGVLQKLFSEGNNFYAQTTDALWTIQYREQSNESLKDGLLVQPLKLLEGIDEGFKGTTDPNASINTPYGHFFVNRQGDEIVRFSSKGFDVISDLGFMNFFKEKLEYCTDGCTDERISGRFYTMGWDHRNRRLLFTKNDGENSFTMSYDPVRKSWISFHSYIPDFYVWDQKHFYTIKDDKIWIHDEKDCDYQTFYGEYYPHIIDFTIGNDTSFNYESSVYNTEAKMCDGCNKINDRPVTFNQAWYRNNTQSTGLMELDWFVKNRNNSEPKEIEDKNRALVTRTGGEWNVNKFLDRTIDHDKPISITNCCSPVEEINHDNICETCSPDEYNNIILFDKYLRKRLFFSNFEYKNIELFTKSVDTLIKTNT